jgi:hypothetical protein
MLIAATDFIHLPIGDWAKIFQIAAIIAGALAAYLQWFRGRLYRKRLEISVSSLLIGNPPSQLLAIARLKNVGLSKTAIKHSRSCLRVFSALPSQPISEMMSVEWKRESTFPIFQQHGWIESGETIEDQLLVTLPEGRPWTYRVEVLIASGRIDWTAASIANVSTVVHEKLEGDQNV